MWYGAIEIKNLVREKDYFVVTSNGELCIPAELMDKSIGDVIMSEKIIVITGSPRKAGSSINANGLSSMAGTSFHG